MDPDQTALQSDQGSPLFDKETSLKVSVDDKSRELLL